MRQVERLYESRYPTFVRVASSLVRDPILAHDVVHEAFTRALERLDSYRGEGSLEAWLVRIVLRVAADQRSLPFGPVPDDFLVALPFPERDEALAAALSALAPRRRAALSPKRQ